jgi:CRP-like cAMP-binding protein
LNEAIDNQKDLLSALVDRGLRTKSLELAPGSTLYEHGAQPKGLFFIMSGNVRTFLPAHGQNIEIEKIGPGEFLGLAAVISDKRAEMSAVAEDAVKAVFISKDEVNAALRRDPSLYFVINSFLSDALSRAYRHVRSIRSNAPVRAQA